MKKHRISFRPQAEADLVALHDYIADQSGAKIASDYIERIVAACLQLESFPNRGTKRDDVRKGLRILGFERRATIAFAVTRTEVVIVGVFYGGRDFERLLRDD